MNIAEIKIVWHGEVPDQTSVEAAVRSDVFDELCDLDKPEDLVFHTVFLSDDIDGPCVIVWGKDGSPDLHAEYHEASEWVTVSEAQRLQ